MIKCRDIRGIQMEPFKYSESDQLLKISKWIKESNVSLLAGFTTKEDGFSKGDYSSMNLGFHVGDVKEDVVRNRAHLSNKLNVPINSMFFINQIHSNFIKEITKKDLQKPFHSEELQDIDGIWTKEPRVLCTLQFADCVPVYFYQPDIPVVGIAHAGWRGTVGSISKEMIQSMAKAGVDPKTVQVAIGPCICGDCYKVDEKVISQVPKQFNHTYQKTNSEYKLDLKRLNFDILVSAGVKKENIISTDYCTSHHDLFFSHRRDKRTGRMVAYIGFGLDK